jgi:hypothetical protein
VCLASTAAWRLLENPPRLLFYEVGIPMPRPLILDISQVAEKKRQAMACFTSQNAIQDYANQISGLNAYRGYTLGKHGAWGEAYFCPKPGLLREGGEKILAGLLSGEGLLTPIQQKPASEGLQDTLARLIEENRKLHAECKSLRQSTSWRLTAPLRTIVSWFRQGSREP